MKTYEQDQIREIIKRGLFAVINNYHKNGAVDGLQISAIGDEIFLKVKAVSDRQYQRVISRQSYERNKGKKINGTTVEMEDTTRVGTKN